jgi:hypothetical protein
MNFQWKHCSTFNSFSTISWNIMKPSQDTSSIKSTTRGDIVSEIAMNQATQKYKLPSFIDKCNCNFWNFLVFWVFKKLLYGTKSMEIFLGIVNPCSCQNVLVGGDLEENQFVIGLQEAYWEIVEYVKSPLETSLCAVNFACKNDYHSYHGTFNTYSIIFRNVNIFYCLFFQSTKISEGKYWIFRNILFVKLKIFKTK